MHPDHQLATKPSVWRNTDRLLRVISIDQNHNHCIIHEVIPNLIISLSADTTLLDPTMANGNGKVLLLIAGECPSEGKFFEWKLMKVLYYTFFFIWLGLALKA